MTRKYSTTLTPEQLTERARKAAEARYAPANRSRRVVSQFALLEPDDQLKIFQEISEMLNDQAH